MSDERLSLYVEAPAARLAARLRAYLLARGWVLAGPDEEAALDGFRLRLRRASRAAVWVIPEPVEAMPDELPAVLSQELAARVTALVEAEDVCAYEVHDRGRLIEKLAARGTEILEDGGSPWASRVAAGEALRPLLAREAGLVLDEDGAAPDVFLTFLPRRQDGAEVVEIDPLVTCPHCGSATRLAEGRFGGFYSCVRYPDCKGRRTLLEARRLRGESAK